MAIRTQSSSMNVQATPLSFMASIEVLKNSIVQTYDKDIMEYKPSRKKVPCWIIPRVSVLDDDNIVSSTPPLVGCKWYEGAPKKDDSNRIKNNSDYEIITSGKDMYALKIMKNVEAGHPIDIYAYFSFVDTKRGKVVELNRHITLYTILYESAGLTTILDDTSPHYVVNPLAEKETADNTWRRVLKAQLYKGTKKIPDSSAVYKWQIYDKGTKVWRDFTEDEISLIVVSGYNLGVWSRAITINAKTLHEETFRCFAHYKSTQVKAEARETPKDTEPVVVHINVEYPKTIDAKVVQTAGARISYNMDTKCSFECQIFYNKGEIPNDKYSLFDINWMFKEGKPPFSERIIGEGRTISFTPKEKGLDISNGAIIYANVRERAISTPVLSNGKYVTNDKGKVILYNKYE